MNAPIVALAFAPDGHFVVAGSQAGLSVRSWPGLTEEFRKPLAMDNLQGLAFSPDGKFLAAAGGDPGERGLVEVRAWPGLALEYVLPIGFDLAGAAAWRADGAALLIAGGDGAAWLAEAKPAGKIRRALGHSRAARGAAFMQGLPITAGADGTLRVWNAEVATVVRTLSNHTDAVHALAAGPTLLASCGADRTVRWWQPGIGRMVRFARLNAEAWAVAWSHNGKLVAAACADGQVRELSPETAATVRTVKAFEGPAFAVAAAPGGGWCVGGERGALRRVAPVGQ